MKKMTKMWIVFAMVALLTVIISACTKKEDTAATTAPVKESAAPASTAEVAETPVPLPELYTIKLYTRTKANVQFSDETDVGKYIKEKFNIVFEFIPYVGDYNEKNNLMLAAGDYPEIIELQGNDSTQKFIDAGALVALDEYLDASPEFTQAYKDQIPFWRISEDKKLYKWEYLVPSSFELVAEGNDIAVRTDALEKQGWPNLVSVDDWIKFLKQAMIDFPETNGKKTIGMVVPFGAPWGIPGVAGVMYEKGGTYTGIAGNAGVIFNHEAGQFEDYLKNEYVLDSFKFFNRLYREGILDKESFTDTPTQTSEKMSSGRALTEWYSVWDNLTANTALIDSGHPEMQYITQPIRSNSQVERNGTRLFMEYMTNPFNSVAITKNAKDPKRIFELVNWASSEEGQMILQSGFEGVSYTIENGKRVPTQLFMDSLKNPESNKIMAPLGIIGSMGIKAKDGDLYNLGSIPRVKDSLLLSERQKEAFGKLGWANSVDYWVKTGKGQNTGFVPSIINDPSSKEGQLEQKMTELRTKTTVNLIKAKDDADFQKIWDELIKQYDKLEPQTVIDKYNKLYKEAEAAQ